jgi:hypothetical protein
MGWSKTKIDTMKARYLVFLILAWLFALNLFAQNSVQILCKVLDFESKYPVSYATIKFEDAQNGVIADEDGEFRLPADFKIAHKVIVISSIGFETLRVELSTLNTHSINTIYLKPRVEALQAVLVSAKIKSNVPDLSEENIVRNAIGRIPTNYPNFPHSYVAYYRDYQLVNNNYYNLNEAILENYDAGFNTSKYLNKNNTSALYSHSLNTKFYQDTLLLNSIYGKSKNLVNDHSAELGTAIQNELELLNIHNPIRNFDKNSFSFIYVFRENFVDNHFFKLTNITYVEDIPLYEIECVYRENTNSKYIGFGKIYIAKSNFAIHKIEYAVFRNQNYGLIRSRENVFTDVSQTEGNLLFEVNVEYKPVGHKMFLNYMTFNNRFVIKEPNPFRVEDFNFSPKDKAFYINFNKPIDKASITRKSNFKLRYQGEKLIIKSIELVEDKRIRIEVVDWSAGKTTDLAKVTSADFSYKLKRITDVFGTEINKESNLTGYQFREFFTQEIFENKQPQEDLIYVNKTMPLSETRINKTNFDIHKYWINSPLKQTKGEMRF